MFVDCEGGTDGEIVEKALENAPWFECVMKRYDAKIRRYISRISNLTPDEIDDVLQDVFIKTYVNLRDYDSSLSFSSWVYRIAHNATISQFRKNKVRQAVSLDDEGFTILIPSNANLVKEQDAMDIKKAVEQAMLVLTEDQREVFVLRFLEDKEYKEISDILRKPIGSVSTLVRRGRKAFEKEFQKVTKGEYA